MNPSLAVPTLKLQMAMCEKAVIGSNDRESYMSTSSSGEEMSSAKIKKKVKKKIDKSGSMKLQFEGNFKINTCLCYVNYLLLFHIESSSVFSLSMQRRVKMPCNNLNVRLRRYEPFTQVDGVCNCLVSPSEFYLYIHTSTSIYVQKWQVMDSKNEEELCLKPGDDNYEEHKKELSEEQETELTPIPTSRLITAIEKKEELYKVKKEEIIPLVDWFRDTLVNPLTL